jgi:hypothetical protein
MNGLGMGGFAMAGGHQGGRAPLAEVAHHEHIGFDGASGAEVLANDSFVSAAWAGHGLMEECWRRGLRFQQEHCALGCDVRALGIAQARAKDRKGSERPAPYRQLREVFGFHNLDLVPYFLSISVFRNVIAFWLYYAGGESSPRSIIAKTSTNMALGSRPELLQAARFFRTRFFLQSLLSLINIAQCHD